jgi:hypothetical protein
MQQNPFLVIEKDGEFFSHFGRRRWKRIKRPSPPGLDVLGIEVVKQMKK